VRRSFLTFIALEVGILVAEGTPRAGDGLRPCGSTVGLTAVKLCNSSCTSLKSHSGAAAPFTGCINASFGCTGLVWLNDGSCSPRDACSRDSVVGSWFAETGVIGEVML
jgi:hypothetical protein